MHPSGLLAVLYCDLDGFKGVNDRLGHRVGDDLLLLVAHRIIACLRPGDMAARLGGDEFGVLLDDLTDEAQAVLVAERLTAALEEPFDTAGQELLVQVSIGIAFTGAGATTASDMINNADTAMYAAKSRGKGTVARFEPSMRSAEIDRLELEDALRIAVRDEQITVAFQPVVDLQTGLIDGFEALARWTHPDARAHRARPLHPRCRAHRPHPHARTADPRAGARRRSGAGGPRRTTHRPGRQPLARAGHR